MKDENQQMREQLKTFKEQNTLQNISNIVPTNSNVKNKTLFRPESVTQLKIIDEFQLTEQFIMNPQMYIYIYIFIYYKLCRFSYIFPSY